jgi:uncharacterized tellurite resistance protein B-like protein
MFFNKSKKNKNEPKPKPKPKIFNYNLSRGLIATGIIIIGVDKEVSDKELERLNQIIDTQFISQTEYNKIIIELKKHLKNDQTKDKLLYSIEKKLTKEEKIKIFRLGCQLIYSDQVYNEAEIMILNKIAQTFDIPENEKKLIMAEEKNTNK